MIEMIIIQNIYMGYCIRRDARNIKLLLKEIKTSGSIQRKFNEPKYLKETVRYLDKIGMIKEISDVNKKYKIGEDYNEQIRINRRLEVNAEIHS